MTVIQSPMQVAIDLESRYVLARTVAKEVGLRALQMFRNRAALEVEHKGLQDVVSVADREVEGMVRKYVNEAFPNDAFLGEESAGDIQEALQHERVIWVVDPIDGTSCFVNGMHAWCVSIGILIDGEPAIGVVYDPNSGELFHAARGRGTFVDETPVSASAASSVREGVLGVGFSHRVKPDAFIPFLDRLLAEGGMFIRNGSGALMIAYVAAGRLIGYYEPHINSWDCLAGIVLVREAGGAVNDFLSDQGLLRGNPIIVAGKRLYSRLVDIICPEPPADEENSLTEKKFRPDS